jgi:hypothetical protein
VASTDATRDASRWMISHHAVAAGADEVNVNLFDVYGQSSCGYSPRINIPIIP